jgi:hypothetical protein
MRMPPNFGFALRPAQPFIGTQRGVGMGNHFYVLSLSPPPFRVIFLFSIKKYCWNKMYIQKLTHKIISYDWIYNITLFFHFIWENFKIIVVFSQVFLSFNLKN